MAVAFDAVLFDWMLTLAHYPSTEEHVALALGTLGRPAGNRVVDEIVAAVATAQKLSDVREAASVEDTSSEAHVHSTYLLYERTGIDAQLADALYGFLGQSSFHAPYPDAKGVLRALHGAGIRLGVVSDIHVDLREHAAEFGLDSFIEAWALSFELGFQKPDRRIFESALNDLGCEPARSLMVGDQAPQDGAAAELGLTCLILPAPTRVTNRGLERVLQLAGVATAS